MTLKEVCSANARHNGEAWRKIVSSAWGEEGRAASPHPHPPPWRRSNRLGEIRKEIRTAKAERQRSRVGRRGGGICELAQGEKWENWSISPSWILNVYDQTEREEERRRETEYVYLRACVCACPSH